MRTLVIDDELHARENIRSIIELSSNNIDIIGEAASVKEALTLINKKQPELLLLDINLPDGNGFDILKSIDHTKVKVIFITAYQEFALQAIKFSAFDYIMKPFNPVELIEALNNVVAEELKAEGYKDQVQAFFSNFSNTTPSQKKIVLKTAEKIYVLDIKNVIRCESDNAYCTIYTNTNKPIVVSKSLKNYEEMLVPLGFLRVHQSHLVNCNFISYYNKQDGGTLVMSDNSNVPVSNQKKPILAAYLDSL